MRNQVRTNWKAKADVYVQAVRDIVTELKTPATAQIETDAPQTLVTDAEFNKMKSVAEKVHIAAKMDVAVQN